MNNYKIMLMATVVLLLGIVLAVLFEEYYRQLVRFLFKFFNGDNIQFKGKNLRLFPKQHFRVHFWYFHFNGICIVEVFCKTAQIKKDVLDTFYFFRYNNFSISLGQLSTCC